jgi:hypothetical protein
MFNVNVKLCNEMEIKILPLSLYILYIYKHRMCQEEMSIFWEVIASVILTKMMYIIITCRAVRVTKITGSRSDDLIYWHVGYSLVY